MISAVFLVVTLRNVDLGKAADAIGQAAPVGLAAALLIVLVDLCLRALRWHVLLVNVEDATVRPPYRLAFGYLTLGFAANFVLPARLGDIARAVLAADTFKAPRLSIFGTILIERVSDGLTFLGLAILSSLVVASSSELRDLTAYALALVVVGLVAAVVGWIAISAIGARVNPDRHGRAGHRPSAVGRSRSLPPCPVRGLVPGPDRGARDDRDARGLVGPPGGRCRT